MTAAEDFARSTQRLAPEPLVDNSLDRLSAWVESRNYEAYDPGDGQMSYLRHLTFGSRKLERVLTAVVWRSPVNIRPLLGIKPHRSTKGMGFMAWGYLKRYRATGDRRDADKAVMCLDWLLKHNSPGYAGLCWGNEFTFTTRAASIPRGAPTIVWSSLIGQAFVEAYEVLGDVRFLDAANSICDWILQLPREQTASGTCLSYVAYEQLSIHNASMLGAALLARVGVLKGRQEAIDVARAAMLYSCSRQHADGAWHYGEASKFHWVDCFHTGYNLDSLKRYVDSTKDRQFDDNIARGYAFFKSHFFEADGRVKYMHDRLMPIDIQCVSQAIDTLSFFAPEDPGAVPVALNVARWAIENMQDPAGYFYYRDLGWMKIRIPMLHWGQGTMFKALAHLSQRLHEANPAGASISVRAE